MTYMVDEKKDKSETNIQNAGGLFDLKKAGSAAAFFFPRGRGYFFWSFLLTCVLIAAFLPYRQVVEVKIREEQVLGQAVEQLPIVADYRPVLKQEAEIFETPAAAAYAIDLKTGTVLYQKNSTVPWPTASLAKLMTALVTVHTVSLDDVVTVKAAGLRVPQPVMGLISGEKISVRNLLSGMLIASANDAAASLAIGVSSSTPRFVELMNSMAEKLQLQNTHFRNPVGLDADGQFSTAEDLSRIAVELLRSQVLAEIVQTQSRVVASEDGGISHWLKTSNKLLGQPGVLGVKTGYTDLARGNLIILERDERNHQVLTVVLGSEKREADSQELLNWIFKSYRFAD